LRKSHSHRENPPALLRDRATRLFPRRERDGYLSNSGRKNFVQ